MPAAELAGRIGRRELRELTAAARIRELPDGLELEFSGEDQQLASVLEFVTFERRCCPFLTFEILLEPGLGPIRLRIPGPAGTKEFLTALLLDPERSG